MSCALRSLTTCEQALRIRSAMAGEVTQTARSILAHSWKMRMFRWRKRGWRGTSFHKGRATEPKIRTCRTSGNGAGRVAEIHLAAEHTPVFLMDLAIAHRGFPLALLNQLSREFKGIVIVFPDAQFVAHPADGVAVIGEQGVFRRMLGLVFRRGPGGRGVVSVLGEETILQPLQQKQVSAVVRGGVFEHDRAGVHPEVVGHQDMTFLQMAALLERLPGGRVGSPWHLFGAAARMKTGIAI